MSSNDLLSNITQDAEANRSTDAGRRLAAFLDSDLNIGELLRINYQDADVLVHDYARQKVRGLPHGSFLVASRMNLDPNAEPHVILHTNRIRCVSRIRGILTLINFARRASQGVVQARQLFGYRRNRASGGSFPRGW